MTAKQFPPPPANRSGWPWTEQNQSLQAQRDWPRMTLVTPSYNQGQFLEETIRSVLLQQYPNLEYIIMDGGSTDNSVEVIRKYAEWISAWESQKDHGQSHAINKGMMRASGTVLNWLNSDDILLPGALEKVAVESLKAPGHLLSGGYVSVWGERRFTYTRSSGMEPAILAQHWKHKIKWHQASIFFTREMWNQCGPLREELHYAMDFDLYLKMVSRFPVKYVDGALATYRFHPQSKAMNKSEAWGNEWCEVAEKNWPPGVEKPDFEAARKQCLAKLCSEVGLRALMRGEFGGATQSLKRAWGYSPGRTLRMTAAPHRLLRFWWESHLPDA